MTWTSTSGGNVASFTVMGGLLGVRQVDSLKAVSLPLPLQLSSGVLITPLMAAWAAAFCFFSNSMVFLNSFSSES